MPAETKLTNGWRSHDSGHQDESEKEVIARQQVSRALFELLEGYLKERKCKPTESRRAGDEAVGVDVFSAKVKEDYIKVQGQLLSNTQPKAQKRKQATIRKVRKKTVTSKSGRSQSDDTDSSSEEDDLELLAAVAVSANDLNTSNLFNSNHPANQSENKV